MRMCEQNCGRVAECYAGGPAHNDWAGHYCLECAGKFKDFVIWERYNLNPVVKSFINSFAKNNVALTETTLENLVPKEDKQ